MTKAPLAAFLRYHLALLDFYEQQCVRNLWDEGRLNEALKSFLASLMPVLRAQRALNQEMFSTHRDLIGRYRELLRSMLSEQGDHAP